MRSGLWPSSDRDHNNCPPLHRWTPAPCPFRYQQSLSHRGPNLKAKSQGEPTRRDTNQSDPSDKGRAGRDPPWQIFSTCKCCKAQKKPEEAKISFQHLLTAPHSIAGALITDQQKSTGTRCGGEKVRRSVPQPPGSSIETLHWDGLGCQKACGRRGVGGYLTLCLSRWGRGPQGFAP
jgi:hypothetical protein